MVSFGVRKVGADTGWVIEEFHADIRVSEDTSVKVLETITVDFRGLEKHGIYRTIPVKYKTRLGNNLNVRLKVLEVVDGSGNHLGRKITYEGDNVKIRIGDADKTATGKQVYRIGYSLRQVVTVPGENAELYWNVTGNGWPVPIHSASAEVRAPNGAVIDSICFTGYWGTDKQGCESGSDGSEASFGALQKLGAGEGLTVAVALDKEKLDFPGFWDRLLIFLRDNWIYATPLLVLVIMLRLYWTRGRDRQYKNMFHQAEGEEVVPLFEKISAMNIFGPPKNLSPGEVGVIVDESVHLRDITAVAIDLARRGFYKIKEIKKKGWFSKADYELALIGKDEAGLRGFEREVLSMLFGEKRQSVVKLSKPAKKAYKHLEKAQNELYKHLVSEKYFSGNPKTVRIMYLVIGIVTIAFGAAFLGPMMLAMGLGPGGIVAGVISGLIVVVFSFYMPARTAKGRRALKEIVGLREWVKIGAWREKIHEKHNFLEEVLPYTIAFGLTGKFLQAFKDADIKNLDWYQGQGPINVAHFAGAMTDFGSNVNSGVAGTRPKASASSGGSGFSGGGFSGGGFGGGGGGSW